MRSDVIAEHERAGEESPGSERDPVSVGTTRFPSRCLIRLGVIPLDVVGRERGHGIWWSGDQDQ